ncbi:MAG: hypothetical protein R2725_06125 [Solirubrobacterales bacterium]
MTTGTRTQVALTLISRSPKILRVSLISLRSSSVWSSPGAKLPAGEGVEGDLVRVDGGARRAALEHLAGLGSGGSSIAALPVPETAW